MKLLATLIALLGVLAQTGFTEVEDQSRYNARIYYFPMFANTASPITRSTIETKYDLTSVLSRRLPEMVGFLQDAGLESTGLDEACIRLKVVMNNGDVYYCDLYGTVLRKGRAFKLSEEAHKGLHRLIVGSLPPN